MGKDGQKTSHLRMVAGKFWVDKTLDDWPDDDFRLFCGDLGNEVTEDLLANAFRHYPSFQRSRVVRNKRSGKTMGYGFVSFAAPEDMLAAMKEVHGKYVGNRPIRLMRSNWQKKNAGSSHNKALLPCTHGAETKNKSLKKFKKLQKKPPASETGASSSK